MRMLIIILSISWSCSISIAQYTYFNNTYSVENYSKASDNILLVGDSILVHGYFDSDEGVMEAFTWLDLQGNVLQETANEIPNSGLPFLQWYDTFIQTEGGYLISTLVSDFLLPVSHGRIRKLSSNFEELWNFELDYYQSDSVLLSAYTGLTETQNGDILALGYVTSDAGNGIKSQMLISKFSSSGELYWHKEYPFYNDEYFNSLENGIRTTKIHELSTGDIIVTGHWYSNIEARPFCVMLDTNGDFMDEISWGSYQLLDGIPTFIPKENDEIIYAYSVSTEEAFMGFEVHKPQCGIISFYGSGNINTQFVAFEHEFFLGICSDLVQSFDSKYVLLGSGNFFMDDPRAYLLKFTSEGDELWFQYYSPPIEYSSLYVADLEVAPDGGFVFNGYCTSTDTGNQMYWVVKTDACGDVEYDGCWPVTAIPNELSAEAKSSIFPSPTYDKLNISLDRNYMGSEFIRIELRNNLGLLVYSGDYSAHVNQITVDVAHLSGGIYTCNILGSSKMGYSESLRFVKAN